MARFSFRIPPSRPFDGIPINSEEKLKAAISDLRLIPDHFKEAIYGLSEEQLNKKTEKGIWSIRQVVHHTADSHMHAYIRFKFALALDSPTIMPYSESEWVKYPDSLSSSVEHSLDILSGVHHRWADTLSSLTPDRLDCTYFHPDDNKFFSLALQVPMYVWHGNYHLGFIMRALLYFFRVAAYSIEYTLRFALSLFELAWSSHFRSHRRARSEGNTGRAYYAKNETQMNMPDKIDNKMFSPCGMNFMVCYVHLKRNKPCKGCLLDDADKPERCKSCEIKNCAKDNGLIYCYKCADFPCKRIVNLDKSYKKRYQVSLIENSNRVNANCFKYFLKREREKWICSKCGGIISLHDRECSECGSKA